MLVAGTNGPLDSGGRERCTMTLEVQIREQSHEVVVSLDGEMDTHTAPRLGEVLEPALAAGSPTVVVDAAALRFLDSSGISELLRVRQRTVEHGGSFRVHSPSPAVRRVLEITGLLELFGVD
jgi:anti-sigma B factor antagonist